MWGNIGEALQNEAGVTKRSFGPAPSRPIIRGFDNDRVLIMNDGTRTGDLSSQSADHNVTIDPANLERIEIVKGPATLLYGSNAVGGVVNAISPQDSFRRSQPQGLRGPQVGPQPICDPRAFVIGVHIHGGERCIVERVRRLSDGLVQRTPRSLWRPFGTLCKP